MNHGILSSIVFSATLFLAIPQGRAEASAPEAPLLAPPPAAAPLTPEEADILKRYDKNGDGRLDENERMAAHMSVGKMALGGRVGQAVYSRLLESFDREHHGYLNPEEQDQAVAFLRANRPILYQALLRRFDRDHDGNLNPQETAALFRGLQRLANRQRKAGKQ